MPVINGVIVKDVSCRDVVLRNQTQSWENGDITDELPSQYTRYKLYLTVRKGAEFIEREVAYLNFRALYHFRDVVKVRFVWEHNFETPLSDLASAGIEFSEFETLENIVSVPTNAGLDSGFPLMVRVIT